VLFRDQHFTFAKTVRTRFGADAVRRLECEQRLIAMHYIQGRERARKLLC